MGALDEDQLIGSPRLEWMNAMLAYLRHLQLIDYIEPKKVT